MASYAAAASAETRESWVPMIAIALGQAIMSFNVASLPVSIGGMVRSFGVPPTTVGTGIVMYSLAVAGFVMLGAKLVQRFGATRVFRIVVALFEQAARLFGAGRIDLTSVPDLVRAVLRAMGCAPRNAAARTDQSARNAERFAEQAVDRLATDSG